MSGLSRTPGKRVWVNPHRGFESRPFRQEIRPRLAIDGAFVFYRRSCINPVCGELPQTPAV